MYDFDVAIERRKTNSEKFDGLKKFAPESPKNGIPLWIADMDFKTAPEIIEAMHLRVDHGIFGYTDIYEEEYQRTVCQWMERRHGWSVKPAEIVVDSGVVPAVLHGLTLMGQPGDGVIIHTPAYSPFLSSIQKADMVPVYSRLLQNQGQYEIDFHDFEKKAKEKKNKIFILCSPHNPTGRVWLEEELRQLMNICRKYGVKIISDEIHCDILRTGVKFTPLSRLFPEDKGIITCTSPSKSFNLAGNHLANIIIPDIDLRKRWITKFHYMPNPISVEATKAAYSKGDAWLDEMNCYVEETFSKMNEYFCKNLPRIRFHIPEATYLAWIDMGAYEIKQQDLMDLFIHNGLVVESGSMFLDNGSDYIRMNVAAPHSVINVILETMKNIIN